jgi:tetratricopeptide (TPR) repeat protein
MLDVGSNIRSPYVTGISVGGSSAFVGRGALLKKVLLMLSRPRDNAIVLFGQRRIGKTSILDHLTAILFKESLFLPVYFDLQDKATWSLDKIVRSLAAKISTLLNLSAEELDSCTSDSFRDSWLPSILETRLENKSLVLLFDEFDVLSDPDLEQSSSDFFLYLHTLMRLSPSRLKFVFVIGRNINDLDHIALSLLKVTSSIHVSLLNQEEAVDLIRLSESGESLFWDKDAVDRVIQLTNGHPLLTQHVCQNVWDHLHLSGAGISKPVGSDDVDGVIGDVLDECRHAVEWLWDGLPAATRIVAAAMADSGPDPINQEDLERILQDCGVRVVIRELRDAPRLLEDWDLVEPSPEGYQFRVELLRLWIKENKPLHRVREELDHIEPVAENFYQAAVGLYNKRDLDGAEEALRRAIGINPNHVKANQLFADILLAKENSSKAAELLQALYQYQPVAARPRLIQALLAQAAESSNESESISLYERVLNIDPDNPEATDGIKNAWLKRATQAQSEGNLDLAAAAYRRACKEDRAEEIEKEIQKLKMRKELARLDELIESKRFQEAGRQISRLSSKYPYARDWFALTRRIDDLKKTMNMYHQALGLLRVGSKEDAIFILHRIVEREPDFKEALHHIELLEKTEASKEPKKADINIPRIRSSTPERAFTSTDSSTYRGLIISVLFWLPVLILTQMVVSRESPQNLFSFMMLLFFNWLISLFWTGSRFDWDRDYLIVPCIVLSHAFGISFAIGYVSSTREFFHALSFVLIIALISQVALAFLVSLSSDHKWGLASIIEFTAHLSPSIVLILASFLFYREFVFGLIGVSLSLLLLSVIASAIISILPFISVDTRDLMKESIQIVMALSLDYAIYWIFTPQGIEFIRKLT